MPEPVLQSTGSVRSIIGWPQTTLQNPAAVIPWQSFAGWQKLAVALWAVCITGAAVALLVSITQLRKATSNNIPGQADEARSHALRAGSMLMGLVGIGSILTTIVAIAS